MARPVGAEVEVTMRVLRSSVLLLTVLLPGGLSTGCTAIGAAVGAAADHHKEKVVTSLGDAREVLSLKEGQEVELRLRDGGTVRGRYQGLDWTLTEARVSRYEATGRDIAHALDLPAPGPGATLELTRGMIATGQLIGYGHDFVVFGEDPDGRAARVSLDRVVKLTDAEGRTVTAARLEDVLDAAPGPILAGLRLEQGDAMTVVPSEDVVAAGRLTRPSSGVKAGLIIGAVIDAVLIASLWRDK